MYKADDPTRRICNHLMGTNHTSGHRFAVGTIIMIIGVGVAKLSFFIESGIVHYFTDVIGYLIHGIGAVPYVELISKLGKNHVKR